MTDRDLTEPDLHSTSSSSKHLAEWRLALGMLIARRHYPPAPFNMTLPNASQRLRLVW